MTVRALARGADGLRVTLEGVGGEALETLEVDAVVAATGCRPDLSTVRELHAQTCRATEGTYPLAASLLGEAGGDCLKVPALGADTLLHPEPGYFALGIKSYGRSPDFLIRTGHSQIHALLERLSAA